MEKMLKIKDYEIPVKSHAGILLSYKLNFKREALSDIAKLQNINLKTLEGFDTEVFYRLLWVLAKTANNDIPPLEIWLEQFDVEPVDFIFECFDDVIELIASNFQANVKKK